MTPVETEIRSWLDEKTQLVFDDMYYGRSLGAAANIRSIASIYVNLAETAEKKNASPLCLKEQIQKVNDYFIEKRGKSSHAIVTAIHLMTGKLLKEEYNDISALASSVKGAYSNYEADNKRRSSLISENLWNTIKDMEKVLLFDYSSTVNSLMQVARDHGKTLDVYVPESRILDGGHQFLRNGIALGHHMHYIPDANLSKYIPLVDASFVGAETLYSDGSIANTAGSDLVGILSEYFQKPLFVPTGLIKLNPTGIKRTEHVVDARKYLGKQLEEELKEQGSIEMFGLVLVPSRYITAFITEYGVIPPKDMEEVCSSYLKELGA